MIEEHLCTFLVEADIPEFVTYNEVIALKLNLQIPQCLLRLRFPDMCKQAWYGCKENRVSFKACLDA